MTVQAERGRHFERRNPLDDALTKGAKLLCGGKAGVAEFTELRWITVQATPRHHPLRSRRGNRPGEREAEAPFTRYVVRPSP